MAEAINLAKASVADGITEAVLTPHVYPGVFDNRLSSLVPVFEEFRATLQAQGVALAVHLGAEVHLHPDAFDLLEQDELPVLGRLSLSPRSLGVARRKYSSGRRACVSIILGSRCTAVDCPSRAKQGCNSGPNADPSIPGRWMFASGNGRIGIGSFWKNAYHTAHFMLSGAWLPSLRLMHTTCIIVRHFYARRGGHGCVSYGVDAADRMTAALPAEIVSGLRRSPKRSADRC